jgi:hypothetical protein
MGTLIEARMQEWEEGWLRDEMGLTVWKSARLAETSRPGESEAEFRIRLQRKANERRDAEVAKLRNRYASKVQTLTARRRRVSASSASRIGTAVRKVGRTRKETADTERAAESVEAVRQHLADLERTFEQDVDALDAVYDAQAEQLAAQIIKPKTSGLHVDSIGVGWMPTT